jgi:hypothetical protein
MVRWLVFLLHIPDVPDSNLGPDTGYREVFEVFLRYSRHMPEENLKLGHNGFLPHPSQ